MRASCRFRLDRAESASPCEIAVALVAAATLATALPAGAVQTYVATPLGSLGGTRWDLPVSRANAINASGQVAGGAPLPTAPGGDRSHAFVHANGAMIDLGTLGGPSSYGYAINDSGQVAGESDTGSDALGTIHHAFLYSNGKMTDLGTLGGRDSAATAINAKGQVAGTSSMPDGVTARAFLYADGSMTELGTLGGASSGATGINDSGQVTGVADVRALPWPPGASIAHAFLQSGGVMRDLGTLGGRDSYAYGINDAGEVTGWSRLEGDAAVHAFRYSGGRMIDLGTLGGTNSYGHAINNRGEVTGESDMADRTFHAFLYTDGRMYDLNSLVASDLGPGLYIRAGRGINDRGQIAAEVCKTFVVIDVVCQAYRLDPIAPPSSFNYQGLWWSSPPESESGWGIGLAHQGDTIFATWFTYDGSGEPWWLSMTANRAVSGTYEGTLLRTTGPAFDAIPFDPTKVTRTPIGSASLTFADANNGTFAYTVDGVFQVKAITRQIWGPLPTCAWSAQPSLAAAANYQDLWWVANGAESGWGVNLTHQGEVIFLTWFTYDFDGSVLWLSATLPQVHPGLYRGTLERTTGPPFYAHPFDPDRVTRTPVGTLTLEFSDGNSGAFTYSMYGETQTKPITRQVFYPPAATVCSSR